MREIKFRGRNGVDWVYSESIWFNEFPTLNDRQIYMPNHNDNSCDPLDIETWEMVGNLTQYTGCNDKNGVEIYEGDIIKDCEGTLKTVVWHNNGLKYEYKAKATYQGENYINTGYSELHKTEDRRWGDEVIGNIFENPEIVEIK